MLPKIQEALLRAWDRISPHVMTVEFFIGLAVGVSLGLLLSVLL